MSRLGLACALLSPALHALRSMLQPRFFVLVPRPRMSSVSRIPYSVSRKKKAPRLSPRIRNTEYAIRIPATLHAPRSTLHALRLGLACALLAASALAAQPSREQVEADWQRQDESRLAQIRQPGTVRFVESTLNWPGLQADDRLQVPKCSPPTLDGRLDDACWATAARIAGKSPDQPSFLLCHDGQRLYVAATLPAGAETRFQGTDATAADAAGAVDGIKDGKYAFHTDREPNPWWQVDLGAVQPIARIVVYNRLDYEPGLHNADNLLILTSDDGQSWTPRYDNKGKWFGGERSGEPLKVELKGVKARYVRLQIPSQAPIWFHLDEVEVCGQADPTKNIALKRPARQSSLSQWSRGSKGAAGFLFAFGKTKVGLGATSDQTAVRRDGDRATVEAEVPLGQGDDFITPEGRTRIAPGGDWQLVWHELPVLGFGKNRVHVQVRAAKPLDPPVELAAEVVVFTPRRPESQVVARRKCDGPWAGPVEFEIAHESAAALIVSAQQGSTRLREGKAFLVQPVRETLERTARLLADSGLAAPKSLAELRSRADALAARERANAPDPAARAALYREARWLAREIALGDPLLDFDRLVFIKRFTQETYPDVCLNHMPWCSRPGGDICVLDLKTGEVRNVINGALGPGHVHGMDLWWDADRVVFGYAKARSDQPPAGWLNRGSSYHLRRTEEPTHIFEMGIEGGGPRQLTRGEWSDLDPTYLANGDIAFVSERCGCSLQCNELDKDETSCNIYAMRPDGNNIRRLSVTKDGDYLPHALDDGTIAYTRWEYQERGWANIQSIWVVRPDGTGADALFKQHFNDPWALEDIRSIPGSRKLVCIATGHHTLAAGPVVVVDPRIGMNNSDGIRIVTPGISPPEGGMSGLVAEQGGVAGTGGYCMTPWALSEKRFLVSANYGAQTEPAGYGIYLIDVYGTKELVYRDPAISCFIPIPLRPRPRPPILGDATDPALPYATCVVNDVGLGVDGVDAKAIRYIRISQRLAWPYDNTHGGQRYEPDVKGVMVNWTPARVLGTVPVEADGSAHFRVPVDTAVYFQILDESFMELRRMRSFISFQPGESRSCTGCHETRPLSPPPTRAPLALLREPSPLIPPPWGERPISFLRDVQPVLDRHCTRCHGGLKPTGGLDFSGGLTSRYNTAYETICAARLISRSNVGDDAKITPPLAFGSHRSKLVAVLRKAPHTERAKLAQEDWLRLVTWIDANGPYHDGFINKRPAKPPYDLPADRDLAGKLAAVHAKRCAECHTAADVSRLDWVSLRQPRASLFLAAPLAKEAGGTARCGNAVYKDQTDPDYQALLQAVEAAVRNAWESPRRDLRALAPDGRQALNASR